MKDEIVIASNNKGKIKEIKEILKGFTIVSLEEVGISIDVLEDQPTFELNALKKAKEIFEVVKRPVIGDDSGIVVRSLNGFPGVLSKRFLGRDKSDSERNEYLIQEVSNKKDKRASFVTAIAYYDGINEFVEVGSIDGVISNEQRGTNGFAYDFILELSNGKTISELTNNEKNIISSRTKALVKIHEHLSKIK